MTEVNSALHSAQTGKAVIDVSALTITIGAFADALPAISAGLSAVWVAIRIYETRTVQRLLGNEVKQNDE